MVRAPLAVLDERVGFVLDQQFQQALGAFDRGSIMDGGATYSHECRCRVWGACTPPRVCCSVRHQLLTVLVLAQVRVGLRLQQTLGQLAAQLVEG